MSVILSGYVRGLEYDLRDDPDGFDEGETVLTLIELDLGGERNILIPSTLKSQEYQSALVAHQTNSVFEVLL